MKSRQQQATLGALLNLFVRWDLSDEQSANLLGVSGDAWSRIQTDCYEELITKEQELRASSLLGIHAALRVILGEPRCFSWIQRSNNAEMLAGTTALSFMIDGGLPAIQRVRRYLEAELMM